jgi:hypothetical protein
MKRPLVAAAITVAALSVGGVVLGLNFDYRADPVGRFEVPANNSTAEAAVALSVDKRGQTAEYELEITEPIENVLQAHLHMGAKGVNGPVVVWLYPHPDGPPVQIPGQFEGQLASGTITPDDLRGPLAGNWPAFIRALDRGLIYANIHTVAHPPGEIRDQVEDHGTHG